MTTLDAPTIYDEALYGEPLELPMLPRTLNTNGDMWTVGEWSIVVPATVALRAPDVQRMIADIRAWTRWSSRQLARILGTSHTTVLSAEAGRPLMEARTGDLRHRAGGVHDVVERVFLLTGRDPAATARTLATSPPGGPSAADSLRDGNPERAYLSAIDVLRPRRTGLLVGDRPRREGATSALHD
jgi:hypothetical protein